MLEGEGQCAYILYGTCGCGHVLGELEVLCTMPYWLPAPLWGIWGVDPRLAKVLASAV